MRAVVKTKINDTKKVPSIYKIPSESPHGQPPSRAQHRYSRTLFVTSTQLIIWRQPLSGWPQRGGQRLPHVDAIMATRPPWWANNRRFWEASEPSKQHNSVGQSWYTWAITNEIGTNSWFDQVANPQIKINQHLVSSGMKIAWSHGWFTTGSTGVLAAPPPPLGSSQRSAARLLEQSL